MNGSIDRDSPTWSTNLLDLYLGTVEVFSQYENVLAYNVGNEVANSNITTVVAPFIKAAARDVKGALLPIPFKVPNLECQVLKEVADTAWVGVFIIC